MAKKTQFLIVHGASVVVVRDGKRKTINPGQGENFTADEVEAVNRAAPGSLRTPINEGSGRKSKVEDADDDSDDDDDGDDADDDSDGDDDDADDEAAEETPAKPAKGKAKAAAKGKGKAKSEDEDI